MTKKEYDKIRYIKNREIILKKAKEYYNINREEIDKRNSIYLKHYRKNNPWMTSLNKARARCNNPKQHGYKNYGGKGRKCYLTIEDVKFLWFRDKAFNLKRFSIDRIDSSKNYELNNCRFIELSINSAKTSRNKKL